MGHLFRSATFVFAMLIGWHGVALAQPAVLARIEALQKLSETNNAQALRQLLDVGAALGADTPYTIRREYLSTLITVQVDAAKLDEAQASTANLLQLAQANKDNVGVVIATSSSASMFNISGKAHAAIARLVAIEAMALQTADPLALWRFYSTLGNAQLTVGGFEVALESTLKSLQYAQGLPKKTTLSYLRSLNLLSNIYMVMTNWDKALQVIEEGLVLAHEVGSTKLKGTLYLNQGATLASLGRSKDSLSAYEKALAIGREAGLVGLQATALNNIGDSYLISKNHTKAEVFARQAMAKFREATDTTGLAMAQSNVGFALMGQGKIREGDAEVRAAFKAMQQSGAIADEEAILGELSRMYEQAGLYREAIATLYEQQKLRDQIFRSDREKAVAGLQEQFDSVQRQKKIELLARENGLKDAEINNKRLQLLVTFMGALLAIMASIYMVLKRSARELEGKVQQRTQELQTERGRTQELLNNMLPTEIARELAASGVAKPVWHESVSVLFTDLSGFTQAATTMPPDRMVAELNSIFAAFDQITDECGVEKIKTIGDSYMAAAVYLPGVPTMPNAAYKPVY
jgi:tetratricopeptide (TPR) repeat protein